MTPGIKKIQLCIKLYNEIWKIITYLEANPNYLKAMNINSLILISTIIKQLMSTIWFLGQTILGKKKKELVEY